ncbi:MAG: hypothetical protein ACREJ3_09935 [Polyangiaceae bacterium]
MMSLPAGRPATEVTSKARRQRFTAEEKIRVLREATACTARGEPGAPLGREALYSPHVIKWREQAERGKFAGLTAKKRGPEAKVTDARDKQLAEQQRTIAKLALRGSARRRSSRWAASRERRGSDFVRVTLAERHDPSLSRWP